MGAAREWLRGLVASTGAEESIDAAGNQWFTLPGESERAVLVGGHIDSVPNGGWLDGCLNVVAGVEVLRRVAEDGTPPVTVRLVNWADEEGARFGRSLFGSSAAAGSMADQDDFVNSPTGTDPPPGCARARTTSISTRPSTRARSSTRPPPISSCTSSRGPCSSRSACPLGVVLGTFGVERHRITWRGQAAHAGSTPMDKRRDALAGAAKLALEIREIARRAGGGAVCTSGGVVCKPGIVTSVVETAEQLLDQRDLDAQRLATMLAEAKASSERFAAEESIDVDVGAHLVDRADPVRRDAPSGSAKRRSARSRVWRTSLPSGPLHDAAEVSRAGVPTVMLFVQSLRGLSHTKLEDTKEEHLELAVAALDRLASKTIDWVAAGGGR